MTKSMCNKVTIEIAEGMNGPEKPLQVAMFASECGYNARTHTPVLPHFKDYKKEPNLINTTRKVLIDNVSKSSAKGYFSSPMGLTRRYGFCCRNCVRQSPTTIFSVRRAWAPFRHGKSDRCRSVSGSPLTADVMQTDTWQTPLTGS